MAGVPSATDAALDFGTLARTVEHVADRVVELAERSADRVEALLADLDQPAPLPGLADASDVAAVAAEDIGDHLGRLAERAGELTDLVRVLVDVRRDEWISRRGRRA